MKKSALPSAVNSSYSGTCQGAYLFHTMLGLVVRPEQWLPDHCSATTIKLLLMFWHNIAQWPVQCPVKGRLLGHASVHGQLKHDARTTKNVSNKIY